MGRHGGRLTAACAAAAIALAASAILACPARADEPIDPAVKAAAGQYYLSAVCPGNAAADALDAAVDKADGKADESLQIKDGKPTPKSVVRAARAYAAARAREGQMLAAYAWPDDIDYEVEHIAQVSYEDSSWASGIATRKRWSTATWNARPGAYGSYIAAVRLYLGLPPAGEFNGCMPS